MLSLYITAKVAGKPVSISEASIRSDLLFDDVDGIDSLPNQAIFDAIQLMGYEGDLTVLTFNKALFSPQWRFLFHTMNHCISSKSTSWDQIPTNIATASDPSPRPLPSTHIPDSILESSGGNHGGQSSSDKSLSGNEGDMTLQSVYDLCISLCTQVTDQAKEIKHLKAHIKKLKKKAKPVITHYRAWMKSVSLKQRLAGKKSLKKQWMQKESASKQRRKPAKAEPLVHKDPLFDELANDTLDFMDTENAQDMGRSRVSTDKEEVSTDRPDEGIPEAEKKFKQLARDEEMARKYDFIQARIKDDRLLALRLQDEEREKFTMEKREKFLQDTIAAQRRFLTEQRAIAIRNKPPTRTQLRNQMMTYLKHVRNKKHLDLNNKTFEDIQALNEKVKRFDESLTAVGSTEDERRIKEMNEGVKDPNQKSLKKRVAIETSKKEDTTKDVDSDDEHRKCLKIVTIEGTMDSEIMERQSIIARLNKVSSPDGDYLVIYRANGNFKAFNCLLEKKMIKVISEMINKIGRLLLGDCEKLVEMLDLGLEVERESTTALDLIIFIK
ncbi:hypothetical protein Tco_0778597 [Tanacetum coccineum]